MRYRHVATYTGSSPAFVTNVTDLQSFAAPGGTMLYSMTHVGGGFAAYRITAADAPVTLQGTRAFVTALGYSGSPEISILDLDGGPALFGAGLRNGVGAGMRLTGDGDFGSTVQLGGVGRLAGDVIRLGQFSTPQGDFLYSVRDNQAAIDIWRLGAGGALAHVARSVLPTGAGGNIRGVEIDDIAVARLGDRSFLLSASGLGNYVAVQMVRADGTLGPAQLVEAGRGLGMDRPNHIGTVAVNGVTYVVVASANSSLTTMRLSYEGDLQPIDHIIDELGTRFRGVTAFETLSMDGRGFLFVGGGDDGISVFTVLPDGKLLHLQTLVDRDDITLADVSAISAVAIDGKIAVFVTSGTERGITQFVFEPGGIGLTRTVGAGRQAGTDGSDLMQASSQTTALVGGAGDDILVSADRPLQMTGGEGADTFVVKEVNGKITITDFEFGVDRLDLSFLGMIRSTAQLTFSPQSYGIKIFYGNSVIWLMTSDNRMLQANAFDNTLFPIAHYAPPDMRTRVQGTAGNDRLTASRNGSFLFGQAGHDNLIGGLGNDVLNGGAGNDTLNGGAGNDQLLGGDGDDRLLGASGNDLILGGAGQDSLYGGLGADTLHGEAGNDVLYGEAGDDVLLDYSGHNSLFGGDGNDRLETGLGHDLLNGGNGNDLLSGGGGHDTLYGGAGNDVLDGGAGNDLLEGGDGNDLLRGGDGSDLLSGGEGNDTLNGNQGHDTLNGQGGNDLLLGEDGNDVLRGGPGNDLLYGGAGHDLMQGDPGNDTLYGGAGNDTLSGGIGDDLLDGGDGDDTIRGEGGNDSIVGNLGNDLLFGGEGDDTIIGNQGNDTLSGGDGSDRLEGGAGSDIMTGDAGADVFVFTGLASFDRSIDYITDFERGIDRIDLSGLGLRYIGSDDFTGAKEVRCETLSSGNQRLVIDVNGDGNADLTIDLGVIPAPTLSDLLL